MRIPGSVAKNLLALFFTSMSLFLVSSLSAQPARAQQDGTVSYEEKKRQANDISVSVIVSGITCTCARFAEDIRNVVNDLRPDGLRVLPVLGVGGLQNLNDVLFLKGIDMGVVDEDNLKLLKKRDPRLYANIEQRVQYITKLYNSEFQVVARNDISTYNDLRGKTVNFNLKDSQTEVSADFIFNTLKIEVTRTNYDNDEAIKKLRNGEISAMIILTGAPQVALAKLKAEDGVHFLPLDQASLPDRDVRPILENYLPAQLTSEQYPNLIPRGTAVPTIAARALLVAYAWPENSPRYKKLTKFVREFFGKIDQFHNDARHPKWKEVNLAADIPGWTRFKPAADWLTERRNIALARQADQSSADLKVVFEQFVQQHSGGQKVLSARERDVLFAKFKQFLAEQSTR